MRILGVKPTPESIKDRLDNDFLPILPIEANLITRQFAHLTGKQSELAKLLNEAMTQTSETWHDNAPADHVNLESIKTSNAAERVIKAMTSAVVFDYPEETEEVTLGSAIEAEVGGNGDKNMLLVGYSQDIKEFLVPNVAVFSLQSPLGEAVLGAKRGQEIQYSVGARAMSLVVRSINLPQTVFINGQLPEFNK